MAEKLNYYRRLCAQKGVTSEQVTRETEIPVEVLNGLEWGVIQIKAGYLLSLQKYFGVADLQTFWNHIARGY